MKNRERALNILRFKDVDRMPAVHFGYWRELLYQWAEQGFISKELASGWGDGNSKDRELDAIIGWDYDWSNTRGANISLFPGFEQKELEVLPDGSRRILTWNGVIERVKPGIISIPSEDDYLLKDREIFERDFLPKMKYCPERINFNYFPDRYNEEYEKSDRPTGLFVGSVLGHIRDFTTVKGMSYLIYDDDEELFADIVNTYAEMQYKCVEEVLKTGAKFDFAHFWEDICFKNGPLISPAIFDKICAPHYKKRCDLLHSYGIDIISLDCDGVVGALLPTWVENGVNTMFPIEVGVWGDQFEDARKKFGNRVIGIGGMDKTAFRKDKDAVDAELERMERLALLGGFIPCPDHRLMPGSKFELVQYYAEKIKEIKTYKAEFNYEQ